MNYGYIMVFLFFMFLINIIYELAKEKNRKNY
jgi:hypothetical protein